MSRQNPERWVWVVFPVMLIALYLNFIWSPDDKVLGPSVRIFYFHMGAASLAGVAFTVTLIASIGYLVTKKMTWDVWAAASAEIGTILTTMILVTGILWGKATWGVWWTWDPRLTATAILWVLFLAYLLLREWNENPERRARFSAVLAVIAYLDVPIDYMTIHWWNSIHPIVITAQGFNLAPAMIVAMFGSMVAFALIFIAWMAIRMRIMRAENGLSEVKNAMRARLLDRG